MRIVQSERRMSRSGPVVGTCSVVVAVVLSAGCDVGGESQSGLFDQVAPAFLMVDDVTCETCMELTNLRILGDTAGPGSLFTPFWFVAPDKTGNFWVSQRGVVKVFDPAGDYIGEVGRYGQGPFEFGTLPRPVYADSRGRMHILDTRNRRITIVNPDLTLASEFSLGHGLYDIAGLPGSDRYLMNSWIESPERIGFPLHVLEGDSIVISFGLTQRNAAREAPLASRKVIAVDESHRVVAASPNRYSVDVWLLDGTHVGTVEGPPLNPQSTDRSGLESQIMDVKLDANDRLWLVIRRPRPDWSDFMTVDASGRSVMRPGVSISALDLYTHRIEVVDLGTGSVIARLDREAEQGSFYSFIGENEIVAFESTPLGDYRLGIWTLSLDSAAQ